MKHDPKPASGTDTSDVSNKDQTHMHAPWKPYMLHATAATPPNVVAHQCLTPSEPYIPAKPAATANTQCNQSVVHSSTEPKALAPPSVPAAKVPASLASDTSMATHWSSHTCHAPECLIEQM